jgi:predicted permease
MSLRRFFRRRQWDEERARELDVHLAIEIDDNVARGISQQEARRQAYLKLGNPTAIREEIWKMNSLVSLEELLRDIRYAIRQLLRSPGFAATAIVTLALGIGVNTAIFSIANGLLFSSMHIQQENRMREFGLRQKGQPWQPALSIAESQQLGNATKSTFSSIIGAQISLDGLSMQGSRPDRTLTEYVTGNYFQALGVQPMLGRFFKPSEGVTPGADPYAVLSYAYWKQHFAADPNIVGRKIAIDRYAITVIGVAPESYGGLNSILKIQVYIPMAMIVPIENDPLTSFNEQGNRLIQVYGRLQPGVTPQQANAALELAARQMAAAHPAEERDTELRGFSLQAGRLAGALDDDNTVGMVSGIFLGLASLVLLLACVNVANLLLVRATVREREMVIRSALGARRFRLIRQMLTESLLLALLGGFGGVLLGRLGSSLLSSLNLESDLPLHFDFAFDWHVLLYSVIAAALAGLFVGIVPAVRLARTNLNLILREGGRGIAGGGHKFRDALVTIQVAAALLLLIVAGLFTRTLSKSEHADLGFDPNHVLTMMIDPGEIGDNAAQAAEFYRALMPRLRALPGVTWATTAQSVPMGIIDNGSDTVTIEGYTPPSGQSAPVVTNNFIGTDYFRTLSIPILEGRAFNDADNEKGAYVAVVSKAMAEKYWPRQDPIGRTFKMGADPAHPLRIVGVVGNARYGNLAGSNLCAFYAPYFQHSDLNSLEAIEVRTAGDPESMIPEVERAIQNMSPLLPIFEVKTLHQALYSPNGFFFFEVVAALAGVMGSLGLLLAVVGVYGVLSYAVSQKTGEIGVRMALGAQRSDILRMIFRQGLWIVGIGLALGLAGGFGAAHLLRGLLTVSTADPATYLTVPALLAAIALLACWIPAHRATRTEPMEALRVQ